MDSVWAVLDSFSAPPDASRASKEYDLAIKDHAQVVKQLLYTNRPLITANVAEILANIQPGNNSIAFLAILLIAWENPPTGPERAKLLDQTLRFLLGFDRCQVRYTGQSFRKLVEDILRGTRFSPLVAVDAVSTALLRLDPSGSMFTSTHLMLVKYAYETAWIDPVLKVLNTDIMFYPGMAGQREGKLLCDPSLSPASFISVDTGLTDSVRSTTILEYNLLSALCYMGKKDWAKAHQALERVIAHPSRDKGVSKIMDGAYKKWVLVGLLKDGKEPNLPSHVAVSAKTTYETLGLPYANVAALFSSGDAARLKTEVEGSRQVWEEDGNLPLIVEVLAAYQRWQIISLRDVYTQVSVSQLRQVTVSAETGEALRDSHEMLSLVRGMIEGGLLNGELIEGQSDQDSYLKFRDDSEYLTDASDFADQVSQHVAKIDRVGQLYKAANDRLGSSKEYVRYLVREQKKADKEANDPTLGFDALIEDEDLMTGILAHG